VIPFTIDARQEHQHQPDSIPQAPPLIILDEGKRRRLRKAFSLEKSFSRACAIPAADTSQSLIYARIRSAVSTLNARMADERIVYLVSDALEHSDSLSIYTRKSPKILQHDIATRNKFIAELHRLYGPLPDMGGITVIHLSCLHEQRDELLAISARGVINAYVTQAGGTYKHRLLTPLFTSSN